MRTAPANKKIREIITMVKENKLVPKPEFQRRLIWTHKDRDRFIDTILKGFPFPEIYVADGKVDLESGEGTQLLVDGQQRVTTILDYFNASSNLRLLTVPPYKDLSETEKTAFLQYDVAVRDLGSASLNDIIEVFSRINATKYSLLDIEINNAVYSGKLKQYAEHVAELPFFIDNNVFDSQDFKIMGDLRYALLIICTFIRGYFNRDDAFEELLSRYNDDFPLKRKIDHRLMSCLDLLSECGFERSSRVWKKADLFTVVVELDTLLREEQEAPQPLELLERLSNFYNRIESREMEESSIPGIYYKASLQATNDRANRLRRAYIISAVIKNQSNQEIMNVLKSIGLA